MPERVFTDEELRIGILRSIDAMDEALVSGDRAAAIFFCKRLRREMLSMQQNYDGWESSLLDSIRRLGGEKEMEEALRSVFESTPGMLAKAEAVAVSERWRREGKAILAMLDAREDAEAMSRARGLHDDALASHDLGMSRVSLLLFWITRRHGSEAVGAALEVAMSADMLGNASCRERAEALMHFTRVHLQTFELREDDEKLTFLCPVCPVCPSGGRTIQAGFYEEPRNDAHVVGPSPSTWGRESLPAYCCHEPVMEKASIEKTCVPLFVVDPPERLGIDPCPTYLYKDPADIPERFYARLGIQKPDFPK